MKGGRISPKDTIFLTDQPDGSILFEHFVFADAVALPPDVLKAIADIWQKRVADAAAAGEPSAEAEAAAAEASIQEKSKPKPKGKQKRRVQS